MNISTIMDCFGCGVCAITCPRKLIEMRINKDGFYEPFIIESDSCTNCGLCSNVCSFYNRDNEYIKPIRSYAAWSDNQEQRRLSSSGGVAFEVARTALLNGYTVCGARYNAHHNRVEHYKVASVDNLNETIGSKYLQSYTVEGFKSLKKKEKNIVFGTPCQIASFRRYLSKFKCEDNFLLIDFFCHGVPSKKLWDWFIFKNSHDIGELKRVKWRDKKQGWHKSYCTVLEGDIKSKAIIVGSNDFYTHFLCDTCLNKACYDNCTFKYDKSCADLRIGDYWGEEYNHNEEGVNSLIVYSKKGQQLLDRAPIHIVSYPFDNVARGQMKMNAKRSVFYGVTMFALKHCISLLTPLTLVIRYSNIVKSKLLSHR